MNKKDVYLCLHCCNQSTSNEIGVCNLCIELLEKDKRDVKKEYKNDENIPYYQYTTNSAKEMFEYIYEDTPEEDQIEELKRMVGARESFHIWVINDPSVDYKDGYYNYTQYKSNINHKLKD